MTEQAHACPTCGQSIQSLGARIRECRALRDWTRAKVAERIGVTPGRLMLWENDRARPQLDDVAALTVLFEVAPTYFAAAFPVPN